MNRHIESAMKVNSHLKIVSLGLNKLMCTIKMDFLEELKSSSKLKLCALDRVGGDESIYTTSPLSVHENIKYHTHF